MEGTLLVTPEKLIATSNSFSSKAVQVKALHDDMIAKVNALSGSWSGDASDAYRQKFAALQASMDKINRMILEHAGDLNEMAEQYNLSERQAAEAASELPASTLD